MNFILSQANRWSFSDRLSSLDWVMLAIYLAALIAIGVWARRSGSQSERSFVQGDRSLPFWAIGISMMATAVAADDFVGEPQFSFASDCALLGAFAVGYVGVAIVAFLFLPRFYASNALTIYGYLGQRFGSPVQVAASVMSCLGNVFSAGIGLFVAAIAIAPLFGDATVEYESLKPWVVGLLAMLGIVGTAYTTIGGIRSVVWTDVLQTCVIFGGGLYAVWFLLEQIPLSWDAMTQHWQTATTTAGENADAQPLDKLSIFRDHGGIADAYSPVTLGLWVVFFVGIFGTNHNYTQRLLACRSPQRAGLGMLLGYSVGMLSAVMFLLIGLLIYLFADPAVMGPNQVAAFGSSEEVYPRLVVEYFPTGLLGLSLAAMMAAVMSSFDSATAAIASSFIADIVRPIRFGFRDQQEQETRKPPLLATVITGLILTGSGIFAALTYDPDEKLLVDFVLGFASFPVGAMLGVFCCALFTRRGNSRSAIAALIVGPIVWLFVQPDLPDMVTEPLFGSSWTLTTICADWFGASIKFAWPWWVTISAIVSFLVCCSGHAKQTSTITR